MDLGEIRVSVDEESVARAAATIREAGKQLHEALGRLEGYAVEHWTIYTVDGARHAYVDDDNQTRWLLSGVSVPPRWRKLYVEKRA